MIHDAGDVSEDGDSRTSRCDQPIDVCLLGDICHDERGRELCSLHNRAGFIKGLSIHIASNNVGPLLGQSQSGGPPDAAAGSRNDGHPSHMSSLIHENLLGVG